MPTYGYRCQDCGYEFEEFQSITADSLTVCPKCQGEIKRKIFAAGIIFKGSGFYVTDNAKAVAPSVVPPSDTPSSDTPSSETPTTVTSTSDASTGGSTPTAPSSDIK
ncbi:MAG: FmdB family zinc ribbon protein [Armatimonadota bacterium]